VHYLDPGAEDNPEVQHDEFFYRYLLFSTYICDSEDDTTLPDSYIIRFWPLTPT
jgi:hypothetical protein